MGGKWGERGREEERKKGMNYVVGKITFLNLFFLKGVWPWRWGVCAVCGFVVFVCNVVVFWIFRGNFFLCFFFFFVM